MRSRRCWESGVRGLERVEEDQKMWGEWSRRPGESGGGSEDVERGK